jgi:hypothetical protein
MFSMAYMRESMIWHEVGFYESVCLKKDPAVFGGSVPQG